MSTLRRLGGQTSFHELGDFQLDSPDSTKAPVLYEQQGLKEDRHIVKFRLVAIPRSKFLVKNENIMAEIKACLNG